MVCKSPKCGWFGCKNREGNATTEKGAKIGDHLKRFRVLVGFI